MSAPARRIDGQRLEHGGALVEVAGGRGRLHHRVLAAHVVRGDRQVRGVLHAPHHVEVGQRGLDHDHVGALLHVEQRLAQRLVAVGGVHLVAAAVAEGRRRVGGLAERAVEGGGELGAVGDDRRVAEALVVERGADGADAAVHHVARRDHVGAGARPARPRCGPGARRVASLSTAPSARSRPQWPWLVYSHRHRSAMTSSVGVGGLDRARGELDGALVVPGARALLVLVRRGCRTAGRPGMPSAAASPASATAAAIDRRSTPGIGADRRAAVEALLDEERQDEVARRQPRLAHEVAQHRRGAQAAQARLREGTARRSVEGRRGRPHGGDRRRLRSRARAPPSPRRVRA